MQNNHVEDCTRRAFVARNLPPDLIEDAHNRINGLGLKEWRKKLIAGVLQAVRYGAIPDEVLSVLCDEGTVAKDGGTKYPESADYVRAIEVAWEHSNGA